MVIVYIAISLFACYSILILFYWSGWRSVPDFSSDVNNSSTTVSVIVPARNEEQNIGQLLYALRNQTYPDHLFEVIVVNDDSTDNTAAIAKRFSRTSVIDLKDSAVNARKKMAIDEGIHAATGELIITTDADCVPKPNWIQTMVSFQEKNSSRFIAAPVVFQHDSSVLQLFQCLDFLVLQGITGASVHKKLHSMCNGANLAYDRNAFFEVDGFQGIDNIASGDDMLLMHKIWKKFPGKVHYLKSKEAIVATQPMKTWREFINQRIRWSSKATSYDDKRILWVLILVYLFNLSFLALLLGAIWNLKLLIAFALLLIAKSIVEFPLVYDVAKFFNKQSLVKYFFFFQPLHIAYTIAAGWLGQFRQYEWKGRTVK